MKQCIPKRKVTEQDSYNKRAEKSSEENEATTLRDVRRAETFESESMTEETSSDGYTPYTRKRGGGGRKRKGKVR